MFKKHSISVIGCGNVGVNWHIPAYKSMNNLSIVGICDVNENSVKTAAEKFNIPEFYTYVDKMLSEQKPEIVAIALPPSLHKEYLEKGLFAGCHVIIEKPLATSLEEVKEIISIVKGYDRKVIVEQNWRYSKISRTVKNIINEGLIGEPYYIEISQHSYAYPGFVKTYVGKGKLATMFEMGPHIVDMIRYWFDQEAESVYAKMPRIPHINHPADWLDIVIINFPEGKTAYIVDDWGFQGKKLETLLSGRVNGSKGSIVYEFKHTGQNTLRLCYDKEDGIIEYDVTEQDWPWGVNVPLTEHFIDCIEKDKEPEINVNENLGTMSIIFTAYESAKNGKLIPVLHR